MPMWDVLAIAPTDDAKAIRRAYAARLRAIDPDRDREAFARLRAALEWALARARSPARQTPPRRPREEAPQPIETVHLYWTPEPPAPPQPRRDEVADGSPVAAPLDEEPLQTMDTVHLRSTPQPAAPARATIPEIANERAQERALLIALEHALQRGDAHEASQLYFRAAATGAVPLGATERMLVRLFTVALEDASFDGAAFRALAKALGWDQPRVERADASDIRQRVLARLAAEDWYDDLVATAEQKKRGVQRARAKVARLILHRIGGAGLWRIDRPSLRVRLDQLKAHHAWLRDRIPPEWIATLESRMRRRDLIAGGLAVLFIGGLLLNSTAVLLVAAVRGGFTPGLPLLGVLAALLGWLFKFLVVNLVQRWRQRAL
jgi:hypothetical protein